MVGGDVRGEEVLIKILCNLMRCCGIVGITWCSWYGSRQETVSSDVQYYNPIDFLCLCQYRRGHIGLYPLERAARKWEEGTDRWIYKTTRVCLRFTLIEGNLFSIVIIRLSCRPAKMLTHIWSSNCVLASDGYPSSGAARYKPWYDPMDPSTCPPP